MKRHFYSLGAIALALNVGGLPAVSVPAVPVPGVPTAYTADTEGSDDIGAQTGAVYVNGTDVQVGDVHVSSGEDGAEVQVGDLKVKASQTGAKVDAGDVHVDSEEDGGTSVQAGDVQVNSGEHGNSITVGDLHLDLEDATESAGSFDALKQSIKQRKQELEQEVESATSSQDQNILEGANQVRLAVHALLASKDLLGGIGQQVSQIARQMNDSVATTTNAEARIQSRGFFSQLLFGGDSAAADLISQEVAKNQENVQRIAGLLDQTNVPANVQTTLKEQIAALQTEQARLQELAQKEKSRWGIFSWRLFR